MMTQRQLYEFVYERLKENWDENEISIIHPDKDIMFEIDKENIRVVARVDEDDPNSPLNMDYIRQVGVERFVRTHDEPAEEEAKFREDFVQDMKEWGDFFKYIGEDDFFNDGLNEFILLAF